MNLITLRISRLLEWEALIVKREREEGKGMDCMSGLFFMLRCSSALFNLFSYLCPLGELMRRNTLHREEEKNKIQRGTRQIKITDIHTFKIPQIHLAVRLPFSVTLCLMDCMLLLLNDQESLHKTLLVNKLLNWCWESLGWT